MCNLKTPTVAGEKVLATSRVIRNRTTGCGVNVASDFVLPDDPTKMPGELLPGLMGVAHGDTISVLDEVWEYEAMVRPLYDGRLGWYPKEFPEDVRVVQTAKACWPRGTSLSPFWAWLIRADAAAVG